MPFIRLAVSAAVASLMITTGCTPMQVKPLPAVKDGEKSTIVIYREGSFNSGGIKMIFGADQNDYLSLYNKNYASIELPSGEHEFFVRSDQADKPYKLKALLANNEVKCLKAYANPSNMSKALLGGGIAYWAGSTFLLSETACPSGDQLKEYTKIEYAGMKAP